MKACNDKWREVGGGVTYCPSGTFIVIRDQNLQEQLQE